MTDQIRASEDGVYGSRMREVRLGEYAQEVALADAAVGGGTWCDTDNALLISQKQSLFRFDTNGSSIDTGSVTTATVGGSSTAALSGGELQLTADTSGTGAASVVSNYTLHQKPGSTQLYEVVVRTGDTGRANNVRQWGQYDASNGFFFQLNGTTLNVGYRSGGVDTLIPFSQWNGVVSDGFWDPTKLTTMTQYNIMYGALSCRWLINGRIAHTIGASSISAPLTQTVNLGMKAESTNTGVTGSPSLLAMRSMSANRLGPDNAEPRYVYNNGGGAFTARVGPGTLRKLLIGNPASSTAVTVYDNTAASGTVMLATFTASANPPIFLADLNIPFNTGLTVSPGGAGQSITVVFD